MSSNSSPVFSPADSLCSLPVGLAFQALIARYITVGTLGVYLWDDLDSVINHYKLLVEHRIRLPTVVYFISRLCCLGLIICATVFQTSPPPMCVGLTKTFDSLYALTIIFTSLLFFFRTRAVFDKNPCIVAFFAGSWLAVVAASLTFILKIAGSVGPAKSCRIDKNVKPFELATTIIPLLNDTFVFAAITWRLYRNSYAHHTLREGIRTLVFGDYLPLFSKAFLQDGQAYYLTTITVNLITVTLLFNTTLPDVLRIIFAVPNVALMNIMACRVFRNTKLGFFGKTEISTSLVSKELDGMVVLPSSLQEVGDVKAASVANTQKCSSSPTLSEGQEGVF